MVPPKWRPYHFQSAPASVPLRTPSRVARSRSRRRLLLRIIRARPGSRARVLALIVVGLGWCLARLAAAHTAFVAHRASATGELLLLARLLLRGAREEARVRAQIGCLRVARLALASCSFVAGRPSSTASLMPLASLLLARLAGARRVGGVGLFRVLLCRLRILTVGGSAKRQDGGCPERRTEVELHGRLLQERTGTVLCASHPSRP